MTTLLALVPSLALIGGQTTSGWRPVTDNASKLSNAYGPSTFALSDKRPEGISRMPLVTHPRYGVIHMGVGAQERHFVVVLDELAKGDSKLYVDANGNGDLTDDARVDWKSSVQKTSDGETITSYRGAVGVRILLGGQEVAATVQMYTRSHLAGQLAPIDNIAYYGDFGVAGSVTLDGKTYDALLVNRSNSANFGEWNSPNTRVALCLDLNHDGKYAFIGEQYETNKPFKIGSKTYEITSIAPDGRAVALRTSTRTVDEVIVPPSQRNGERAVTFVARTMDAKSVAVPASYKGRIVMLDFWATWCGPCMGEVPGLVKAYREFHSKGFDVLGVTLDEPNQATKVRELTRSKGMAWPQVYDGKAFHASLALKFGVVAIPQTYLIDGDSGRILAQGEELRGARLMPTLARALSAKRKPKSDFSSNSLR